MRTPRTAPTTRSTTGRSAFTLVELLVVIGIIAVLISILLPALSRARSQASMTNCMSNLKSIGQAAVLYSTAYKGSLPVGQMDRVLNTPAGPVNNLGGGTNWVLLLQNALDSKYPTTWDEAIRANGNNNKLRTLFLCPDGPIEGDLNAQLSAVTHYASHPLLMPMYSYSNNANTSARPRAPYKMSQIRIASEKVLIMDASVYMKADASPATWVQWKETPVATLIDNHQLSAYNVKLFTNWTTPPEKASPPINLDDSIRMLPSNTDSGVPTASRLDGNADTSPNANNIRFRHMRNTVANCLMADGHVESFKYNPKVTSLSATNVTTLKKRNIFVNYVP